MFNPDLVTKYSGPPGTGKTTTLLNVVNDHISGGIAPEDVVFTTFTRAGANEARDRACVKFNLSPNRFPYFRTLHSICHSLLPKREVMSGRDWAEVGRTLGLFFTARASFEEAVPRGLTKGDYLMSLWSLSRVMRISPPEIFPLRGNWLMGHEDVSFREFEMFIKTVAQFKEDRNRIDFTDMLEGYLLFGPPIGAKVLVIDEAQDLSYIHWEVLVKMAQGTKFIIVGGDDDQCIHEWNGAFPKAFINLPARTYSVLPQSFRIPKSVHDVAEKIIAQVRVRLPKVYQPRAEAGQVTRVDDIHQIDLSKGSWLLLARNISFLQDYVEFCREKGYHWTSPSIPSTDQEVLPAIIAWKKLMVDPIVASEAKAIYKFMTPGNRVKRGFKKKLEAVPDATPLTHAALVAEYGLLALRHLPWPVALDGIIPEEKTFLVAVEKVEGLAAKARIEIGTIHSAKGKEADNVVLNPSMSFRTFEAFEANPDSEHRVWYVGVTRARNALYILNPSVNRTYPI